MQGRRAKGVAIAVAAVLMAAGCATRAPRVVRYPEEHLLPGYSGYFSADIGGNRELFSYVMMELEADAEVIINRTERITGGFSLQPRRPTDLMAIATGNYPRGLTQLSLRGNSGFENTEIGLPEKERLEVFVQRPRPGQNNGAEQESPRRDSMQAAPLHIALPQDDLLYVTSGSAPTEQLTRLVTGQPDGRETVRRRTYSSLISVGSLPGPFARVVFQDPGSGLIRFLGLDTPGLPISDIELSLFRSGASLTLDGVFVMNTAQEAELFSRISRFFVLLFVSALGLDGEAVRNEVEITVVRNEVVFSGIPLSREELVSVIRSFGAQP
jgi:hypothetical protein